jgi:hypothetical protein
VGSGHYQISPHICHSFLNIASEINLLCLTFKNQLIQESRKVQLSKSEKGTRSGAISSEGYKNHKCMGNFAWKKERDL